jgi:hypothetical protein
VAVAVFGACASAAPAKASPAKSENASKRLIGFSCPFSGAAMAGPAFSFVTNGNSASDRASMLNSRSQSRERRV